MVNSSHFLFIQEHVIEFWQEVMDALGPNNKIAVVEGGIRVEDVRVEEVKVKDVKESKPMATVVALVVFRVVVLLGGWVEVGLGGHVGLGERLLGFAGERKGKKE
ncbi:hypothetical protein JHK87_015015 [Glycine soja]|nr:hypothetical protein JHK87_015015 [Glycine soja]